MDKSESGAAVEAAAPKVPKEKQYAVMFQENRPFELYVGRAMIRFEPYETKPLPASIVNHPDFAQMSALFSIREVK